MSSGNRPVACFSVYAAPQSAVLSRLMNVFARLDRMPTRMIATLEGPAERELCVDLQFAGMATAEREMLATRLRGVVDVGLVLTSEKGVRKTA